MATAYDSWNDARTFALNMANRFKLPVAIRKVREYGKTRFSVSLACNMDSDYARAEIVRPGDLP